MTLGPPYLSESANARYQSAQAFATALADSTAADWNLRSGLAARNELASIVSSLATVAPDIAHDGAFAEGSLTADAVPRMPVLSLPTLPMAEVPVFRLSRRRLRPTAVVLAAILLGAAIGVTLTLLLSPH
jgi:hypothetical protein